MTMKPTDNDVLSGRGAWFNQHPGNTHFRRMLDEQKAAYMAGTKKQKMDISKAIVEAIYSMDPPGRFLKQCTDTGQWSELSTRDAADKAAQAMAYAVSGKEKSKRRKERRRQSRRSLSLPKDDDVDDAVPSQPVDRSAPPLHLQHSSNKHLEGNDSSSTARNRLVARGSAATKTNNAGSSAANVDDSLADDVPGNSLLQQQLPPQMQQTSSTFNLPITSIDQNANQNGLIQVLAQAVQQQRQHHHNQQQQQQQQQLIQSTLGQNPLGQLLQTTQTPLQPASLDGFTQLLAQAQQQQQQQQQQHLILLQHLLNQQNVLSSDSLQTNLFSSAPSSASQRMLPSNGILLGGASSNYSSAPSAPAANNNISQNLQQSNLPHALMLGSILSNLQNQPNNIGMLSAPQGAQQLDQLQRSLMLQQNQLLASILSSSNQSVNQQPQQPTWEQIALLGQIQNSQNPPPMYAQPSTNADTHLTRQEDNADDEHSVSEEKSA